MFLEGSLLSYCEEVCQCLVTFFHFPPSYLNQVLFRVSLPGWNKLGGLKGFDRLPKSNRSKARKPVMKGNKAKDTKRSNCIRKIHSSSSESESSDELSSKSDSSVTTKSSSSSSSNTYSSDSDESAAPLLPNQKPPTPNLTLQNQKPVPSHSSRSDSSYSENSTATPILPRKTTPPPPTKSLTTPPTPILKKQSPYSDPLWFEMEATSFLDSQTSLSRKASTPLRSTPGSASNKLLSFVSSFGFGGGSVEDPRESDEDNVEDASNPEQTVVDISGAGEHPPGEEMYGEVGSRVSVDSPIDESKEESSKVKKKKKKKQKSVEVDSDDSDTNSDSTTNTKEKKKHDTSSKKMKKKKKKKSREDMDASKKKNSVFEKKSGNKDDREPVCRSRINK